MSGSFPRVAWEQKDTHSTHGTVYITYQLGGRHTVAEQHCLRLVGCSYSYLVMHFTLYGNGGETTGLLSLIS